MKTILKKTCVLFFPVCAVAVVVCTGLGNLAGAGSETTNSLTGTIAKADGTAASRTIVQMIPQTYDRVKDMDLPASFTDTTDPLGRYHYSSVDTGTYTIAAVHIDDRTRALITGVHVAGDTVIAPAGTLGAPGSVKIMLPDSADKITGYIYVPGTAVFAFLINSNASVVFDSVPAGTLPAISYALTNSPIETVIRYDVPVVSGDTTTVWNPSWKYARQLVLNTTSTGAGIANPVMGFPVLVRLTSGNFVFAQAKTGGADIRFTKPDNTFLSYEIEQWDPVNGAASIWVKTDTILGNNDSQCLTMYWGNSGAEDSSNSAAVFDTVNGFQGVWHLAEAGNTTAYDATGNHYDGTPYTTVPAFTPGAIGIAREFDGVSNGIRMTGTAGSGLNFPENGHYSVSAWVYSDTLDDKWHLIVGKSNGQYYLKQQIDSRSGNWEFVEYHDLSGWEITETPMVLKTWKYLTGIREGGRQYLYVDGQLVDSTIKPNYNTASRNTSDDVTIGRYHSYVTFENEGYCFFDGKIDEVRISSVVYSGDWIKLSFMNQQEDDILVVFK